jgi:hypothetical protein
MRKEARLAEFTITRQIGAPVETFKLPISGAIADFNITPKDGGTELNLHYSYTPNMLGRLLKGYTDKQMRKGITGMTQGLQIESERVHAA